jgi:hypothetical protein
MHSNPTWYTLSQRSMDAQNRLGQRKRAIEAALSAGDASTADPALPYLEADPYYFRSGYTRCRLAGRSHESPSPDPSRTGPAILC